MPFGWDATNNTKRRIAIIRAIRGRFHRGSHSIAASPASAQEIAQRALRSPLLPRLPQAAALRGKNHHSDKYTREFLKGPGFARARGLKPPPPTSGWRLQPPHVRIPKRSRLRPNAGAEAPASDKWVPASAGTRANQNPCNPWLSLNDTNWPLIARISQIFWARFNP